MRYPKGHLVESGPSGATYSAPCPDCAECEPSRVEKERNRYKREREDLLQVLFQSRSTREAVADRILGADTNGKSKLDSGSDWQKGRSA